MEDEGSEVGRSITQKCDLNVKTIVIPASLRELRSEFFANAHSVEVLEFEAGSSITRLEVAIFDPCLSLKSIYIPASVEVLRRRHWFPHLDEEPCPADRSAFYQLQHVTFEPGSRLQHIGEGTFYGCEFLQQICIPASVEKLNAASLPRSRNCRIEVDNGNRYFRMEGAFLRYSNKCWIVRYCGTASEVTIPDEVESIGEYCFVCCQSIRLVRFGSMSKLYLQLKAGLSLAVKASK
jgi:hypothetical protein